MILSFIRSFISPFVSLQFSIIKNICYIFLRNSVNRVFRYRTNVNRGFRYREYRTQAVVYFSSIYIFIFVALRLNTSSLFFSGTIRPRRLKLGTHTNSGSMYRLYQNQDLPCPSVIPRGGGECVCGGGGGRGREWGVRGLY